MNARNAIERMDDFWSRFHGLPGKMRHPGIHVATCAADAGSRVHLLKRGATAIVSAPECLVSLLSQHHGSVELLFHEDYWNGLPGLVVDRIIGPAYLGCLSPASFKRADHHNSARLLTGDDGRAIDELRQACDKAEWDHGGIDEEQVFRMGVFSGGRLLAAAGCKTWTQELVSIGLITHPNARGLGHGAAVASKAAEEALARGLTPAWRTLLSNEASIRTARSMGFMDYAVTLTVRLAGSEP